MCPATCLKSLQSLHARAEAHEMKLFFVVIFHKSLNHSIDTLLFSVFWTIMAACAPNPKQACLKIVIKRCYGLSGYMHVSIYILAYMPNHAWPLSPADFAQLFGPRAPSHPPETSLELRRIRSYRGMSEYAGSSIASTNDPSKSKIADDMWDYMMQTTVWWGKGSRAQTSKQRNIQRGCLHAALIRPPHS